MGWVGNVPSWRHLSGVRRVGPAHVIWLRNSSISEVQCHHIDTKGADSLAPQAGWPIRQIDHMEAARERRADPCLRNVYAVVQDWNTANISPLPLADGGRIVGRTIGRARDVRVRHTIIRYDFVQPRVDPPRLP